MVSSKDIKSIQTILNEIENNEIILNHRLQRKPGQWNKEAESLLIDSILRGIEINNIYTVVDKVTVDDITKPRYSVIDGIQRINTIQKFTLGNFKLSKDLKPVDGEEIAGKEFLELSPRLQKKIESWSVTTINITEYTDEEIKIMFKRQNNGKALNKGQLRTTIESNEVLDMLFDLTSHKLFIGSEEIIEAAPEVIKEEAPAEENKSGEETKPVNKRGRKPKEKTPKPTIRKWKGLMSPAQIKNAVDRDLILETLMLIFKDHPEAKYSLSFAGDDIDVFIEDFLNENISKESKQIKLLQDSMTKLHEAFKDKGKIKINATSIPMVLYGAYKTVKDKKSFTKYADNLMKFIEGYENNKEYNEHTDKQTTSNKHVTGRLNYFKDNIIPS